LIPVALSEIHIFPDFPCLSSQADDTFGPDYGFLDVLWVLSEDLHGLCGLAAGKLAEYMAKNLCLIYIQ